ncbi:MAG: methyltransferase domain-containing protein [Flavobacteriales bacterium]|nr:methyltransferase domain-containing protein [Flavobacteriales bacterium]
MFRRKGIAGKNKEIGWFSVKNEAGVYMVDLFDGKAADWDSGDMKQKLSKAIGAAIVNQVPLKAGMQVMDFGAGTGLVCSYIAPHVAKIAAVDISPSMLGKLAEKPELQGKVDIICQDILAQPLKDSFDLIISAMAMHHVEDTDKLIHSFANHLRVGGSIALADLDHEDGTFHPADIEGVYHDGFERHILKAKFKNAGFSDVQFKTAITILKDGKAFPVFLLVATKG